MQHRSGIDSDGTETSEPGINFEDLSLCFSNVINCSRNVNCLKQGGGKKLSRLDRTSKYFLRRKKMKARICESKFNDKGDNRPFVDVMVKGIPIRALMDSGANVSVFGKGFEEILEKTGVFVHSMASAISTANGDKQEVLGYVTLPVTYSGKTRYLEVFIVPSLTQSFYFGMDAWDKFGIKPVMVEELVDDKVPECLSKIEHTLSDEQRRRLVEIINQFPNSATEGLGRTNILCHTIDVGTAEPVKQRFYPVSPAVQQQMYSEIERMLKLGVIQESDSSWSSPMAMVKKPNGKIRLCLDARKVNEVTKKAAYPLPLIDGILSRLDRTKFISTVDLKDAFWQIPLSVDSRDKTAFTIPGCPLYEFVVMPFGLCNAAQTLCKLVDKVIPHHLRDRVHPYLDDLLITTETLEEHLSLLKDVSDRLRGAGLTVNMEKSKFLLGEIDYLGYVVGGGCLRANQEKVKAIAEFPTPKTVRQLRRFLGVTGWYRRFVANYSVKACALTELLKGGKRFKWTTEAQLAFDALKKSLLEAPVLINPDFSRHFYIQCDASTTGVGSVLFQRDDDGTEHPIAFYSQKLNAAQRNYNTTELECLAAVLSVKKFRGYVEGHPFTIITDHSSLKWLRSQRDLSGRLARWSLKLQAFDFNMEFRKGSQNTVPDALSRVFAEEIENDADYENCGPLHINLQSSAFQDEDYINGVQALKEIDTTQSNMREENGVLYINLRSAKHSIVSDLPVWKIVVPQSMTHDLMCQAHIPPSAAHPGARKTLEKLQRYFFWPKMSLDVRRFVSQCESCKMNKAMNSTSTPPIGNLHVVSRPWQKLYLDFLGPYPRSKNGNCYILIVLDQLSRYVLLKPLKNATALALVKYLEEEVFLRFGVPEMIFTDNGRQFESNLLKHLLIKYGVNHDFTPKYHPQPNVSERTNRSILEAIRAYVHGEHKNWDLHLPEIAQALRNVTHSSTQYSPHFMVFGQHQIMHGSSYSLLRQLHGLAGNNLSVESKPEILTQAQEKVIQHLREAHQNNARRYNLRTRPRNFAIDQKVFVRNFSQSSAINNFSSKLDSKFLPALIKRKVGNVSYEVTDEAGKLLGVYHTKDIKW